MKFCKVCNTKLGRGNKSGLCWDHWVAKLRGEELVIPEEVLRPKPRISDIAVLVCDAFLISRENLFSHSRKALHVRPRHALMFLSHVHSGRSDSAIGIYVGGRDHTTVRNSVRVCREIIKRDEKFRAKIDRIEERLLNYDRVIEPKPVIFPHRPTKPKPVVIEQPEGEWNEMDDLSRKVEAYYSREAA